MTAYERITDWLRADGRKVTARGQSARAKCPGHDGDSDDSLAVRQVEDSALLYCHGGCDLEDVLAAMGMTKADLYDEPRTTYEYRDHDGSTARRVFRTFDGKGKKTFRQAGDTGANILFRLPKVIEAVRNGEVIYLVEGESDVIALESIGVTATTAPQGADSFKKVDVAPLAGASVVAVIDKDDAGKKWATQVEERLTGVAGDLTFVQAAEGKDSRDHISAGLGIDDFVEVEMQTTGPRVWKASELTGTRQSSWLAARRIPKRAVTILVGDEGIGKSLFWVWVAAAVTTGSALPEFGIPARKPGIVLLVITEDEWAEAVRPRLEVAGADLDNIRVICTEEDGSGSPVFPRDMHLVRRSRAALVVVDAFLDTVASNLNMKDPQQARLALHPWKEAATTTGAAMMLLTHTNRADSKNARDRYGITGELRKKARMTLYAQLDEDDNLVIGPEKSNITGKLPATAFGIEPVNFFPPNDEHDGTVPKLVYRGESTLSAREHIEANFDSAHGEDREDRSEAEVWLEDYLTENPGIESKKAKDDARKAGISERTLKRAAKAIGVVSRSEGFPRTTRWDLHSGASQATGDAHVPEGGPTGPTGEKPSTTGFENGPTAQSGQSGHAERHGPTGDPTGTTERDHLFGADCDACGRHLGKAEMPHGTCIQCRRIAEANKKASAA